MSAKEGAWGWPPTAQLPFLWPASFPVPATGPPPDRAGQNRDSQGTLRPGLKWSEDPVHPQLLPGPGRRSHFTRESRRSGCPLSLQRAWPLTAQLCSGLWLPGRDLPSSQPSPTSPLPAGWTQIPVLGNLEPPQAEQEALSGAEGKGPPPKTAGEGQMLCGPGASGGSVHLPVPGFCFCFLL